MFEGVPKGYRDPFWSGLASMAEQEVGLPEGLLRSILTKGERSNADQVSSAGARTPFQVIPETRQALIKKYGVDAYESPESAAKAAALVLKEGLDRNKGDVRQAVGEYIGGVNRKNWGPTTMAYIDRVSGSAVDKSTSAVDELVKMFNERSGGSDAQKNQKKNEGGVDELVKLFNEKENSGKNASQGTRQEARQAGLLKEQATQAPMDVPTASNLAESRAMPKPPETSFLEKVGGGLEAAATMATGATSGLVGGLYNTLKGGTGERPSGNIPENFQAGMEALTYAPKTQAGQEILQGIGNFINEDLKLPPVLPIVGPQGALATNVAAMRPKVAVANAGSKAAEVAPKVSQAIKSAPDFIAKLPDRIKSNIATMDRMEKRQGSVGAQGVDIETLRRGSANELPVPINLTKGQATRDFEQTRFERETAKNPELGKPLRDAFSSQSKKILMNMDAFIDQTGAETVSSVETGKVITKALIKRADEDRAKINQLYKIAEQSPEATQPVKLNSVVDYINSNKTEATLLPAVQFTKKKLIELGMAAEGPDGNLIGKPTNLISGEKLRAAINASTGDTRSDIRQATIIKGLYDQDTANAGGQLYKTARRARENFAKRFENRAVVADLLETKRNSDDRRVALEDVQSRIIDKGSREDLSVLMSILGNSGPEGNQALNELRGATLQKVKDAATKSAVMDENGNPIISADKLNREITKLDQDGKLDRLFGKKGAEQLRTINEVSKVILTVPPGSVNTSNTASVLAGLMDVALTAATGGIPTPIATSSRLLIKNIKDKKIKSKVEAALNSALNSKPNSR
jgi:hypothetical protein